MCWRHYKRSIDFDGTRRFKFFLPTFPELGQDQVKRI
jgi:hypothetical protein